MREQPLREQPLRGALVGAGYFAQFHAEGWQRTAGAELVAVADPEPGRAEEFAHRWGIPRAYTEIGGMLKSEHPDFVDIVTRPENHRALAEAAAKSGAHIICQKPLAPTWEECIAMVECCGTAGVRLLVHENWRWQPWYREARRLLDAGSLGRLFYVGFQMRTGDGRGPEPYSVQPYFREMDRLLLYETVVHFLDTFRYLAGEIVEVFCRTARINPVIRGEDSATVHLRFASGAAGLIDANRISGPAVPEVAFGTLRLEGESGLLRLTPDGRLWLTEYGGQETEHRFPRSEGGYRGDSIRALQQHLVDALRTGTPAESEGRDYLRTVALVSACYESAAIGAPISIRPDSVQLGEVR